MSMHQVHQHREGKNGSIDAPTPDLGAAIFNFLVASTNAHAARIRAMTPEQVREMARAELQQIREWENWS